MCKRNTPQKNKASTRYVRETPQINKKQKTKTKKQKTKNKKERKETSMGCVRETTRINKMKPACMGCVRETPETKMKPARDVEEKLCR